MVIDLPLNNDHVTNCDRLAQGLMGRCCGYYKSEHNVKVVSSLKHATNYTNWYLNGVAPSRPSMKTIGTSGALAARESSAYEKSRLTGKPSGEDDEEPVDVADVVVDGLHALQLTEPVVTPRAPRRKVKTVTAKRELTVIEVDLDEVDAPVTSVRKDADYASDSGDDFIQSDDDEFYESLVVDWTIRSETIKARLMARLKPTSEHTMAVATQMMKDVFE